MPEPDESDELPTWLSDFLFDYWWPDPDTPEFRAMSARIRATWGSGWQGFWMAHKAELLARWAAEGREGKSWVQRRYDPDPNDPMDDPRACLGRIKTR